MSRPPRRSAHPRGRGRHPRPSDEPDPPRATAGRRRARRARGGGRGRCADIDRRRRPRRRRRWRRRDRVRRRRIVVGDVADEDSCARRSSTAASATCWAVSTVSSSTSASPPARGSPTRRPRDWDRVFAVNVRSHFLAGTGRAAEPPEGGAARLRRRRSPVSSPAAAAGLRLIQGRRSRASAGTSPSKAPGGACGRTWSLPGSIDTPLGPPGDAGAARDGPARRSRWGARGRRGRWRPPSCSC